MPKSKKKKNRDFQKVKLKVGKKLPSGQNVTNLAFKTRQIHLFQKIKSDNKEEITSKNKLTLAELLHKCGHHSSNSRLDALAGLRELWFNNHVDLLKMSASLNYFDILKKLATMFIDDEASVRHSVISLFRLICRKIATLENESSSRLIGDNLYKFIHAFMLCALNNIHEDIKLDALLLFDILLESFAKLMALQAGELLQNLVGLLCTPMSVGSAGSNTAQRLSMNPDSKLSAMKFRVKVLQRIEKTLNKTVEMDLEDSSPTSAQPNTNGTFSDTLILEKRVKSRYEMLFSNRCIEVNNLINQADSLKNLMSFSFPILCQCWKEAKASFDDGLTNEDAFEVMVLVVGVLYYMFKLCFCRLSQSDPLSIQYRVPVEWLSQKFYKHFEMEFLTLFPYSFEPFNRSKKRKKDSTVSEGNNYEVLLNNLNLHLCCIMTCFLQEPKRQNSTFLVSKLKEYLCPALRHSKTQEQHKNCVLIFFNLFQSFTVTDEFSQEYKTVFEVYQLSEKRSEVKKLYFQLLSHITKHWPGWEKQKPLKLCSTPGNAFIPSLVDQFLLDLPTYFRKTLKQKNSSSLVLDILSVMKCGPAQQNALFGSLLTNSLMDMLDVLDCNNDDILVSFFCWLSRGFLLKKEHFKKILVFLRQDLSCSVRVMNCCINSIGVGARQCLPLKDQVEFNNMKEEQHTAFTAYLGFLFSLQTGIFSEEWIKLSSKYKSPEKEKGIFEICYNSSETQWHKHVYIIKTCMSLLENFHLPPSPEGGYRLRYDFLQNFESIWRDSLDRHFVVPVSAAYSLILLLHRMSMPHVIDKPSKKFTKLVCRVIGSVLCSFYADNEESACYNQASDDIKQLILSTLMNRPKLFKSTLQYIQEFTDTLSSAGKAQEFLLMSEELKMNDSK